MGFELGKIQTIDPISYRQMVGLQQRARTHRYRFGRRSKGSLLASKAMRDKVRDETEWTELVDAGVNVVTGSDPFEDPCGCFGIF